MTQIEVSAAISWIHLELKIENQQMGTRRPGERFRESATFALRDTKSRSVLLLDDSLST